MTESPSPIPMILDLVKVAWPELDWRRDLTPGRVIGFPPRGNWVCLVASSLDSFARVLRAMPPEVRERFGRILDDECDAQKGADGTNCHVFALMKPPEEYWPLLHRAAFGEGKPERYQ